MSSDYPNEEHHLHLYGCLNAKDAWTLGKEIWKEKSNELNWYANEYQKAWGRTPRWQEYWNKDYGQQLLAEDFELTSPTPFPRFQSCFNLLIALFKLSPDDTSILEYVIKKLRNQGTSYCELRVPLLEQRLDEKNRRSFVENYCKTAKRLQDEGGITPRIAFSLSREDSECTKMYHWLRKWMDEHEDLGEMISAIDFCFFEEGYPPSKKFALFEQIRHDNQTSTNPLAILYHVGESFSTMSVESSIRWVLQAAQGTTNPGQIIRGNQTGVHRLGHAISLGVDPKVFIGQTRKEKVSERKSHLKFCLANDELTEYAKMDKHQVNYELQQLDKLNDTHQIEITYTEEYCKNISKFQESTARLLKRLDTPIESCPTSNLIIGEIKDPSTHPIRFFIQNKLPFLISSDDPGIFDTSLKQEFRKIQDWKLVDAKTMAFLTKNTPMMKSKTLASLKPAS